MTWNPGTPCVYGMQWAPTRQDDLIVTGTGSQSVSIRVVPFTSGVGAGRMWTFANTLTPGADDVIDIYRSQDLVAVTPVVNTQVIASDAAFGNSQRTGGLFVTPDTIAASETTAIFYSHTFTQLANATTFIPNSYRGEYVDSGVQTTWSNPTTLVHRQFIGLPSVPSSQPANLGGATSASWGFHVNSLDAGLSASRRVTGLTVTAFCQRYVNPLARNSEFDQPYRVRFGVRVGGSTYQGQFRIMPNVAQDVSYTWVRNPATNLPWTAAELAAFATGGANGVVVYMSRPESGAVRNRTAGAVHRVTATVTHVAESRVGVATRATSTQVVGWNEWNPKQLNGSTFSWVGGQEYLLNWNRQPEEPVDRLPRLQPSGLGVRALSGDVLPPSRARLVEPQFVSGVPRNVGNELPTGPALVVELSVDGTSQPHAVIGGTSGRGVVSSAPGFASSLRQLVYRGNLPSPYPNRVQFTVRSQFDRLPDANLDVVIVGNGFAGLFEATDRVVVSPDQLQSPRQWLTVEAPLVPLAWQTISATTGWYAVEFLTAATDTGWEVLTLATGEEDAGVALTPFSGAANTQAERRLFGGNADEAAAYNYTEDGTGYSSVRAVTQMAYKPATPPAVTAASFSPMPHGVACPVVTWAAHVPGTCDQYGSYELQRFIPGADWQTVAEVNTSTVRTFYDLEAPRNTVISYRVRHTAASGVTSDWSTTTTLALSDTLCGYVFASNHWPGALTGSLTGGTIWYDDLAPRTYQPLEQLAYVEFESGDGAVVTKPLVDRLDEFAARLLVAADGGRGGVPNPPVNNTEGRRVFDPLLQLSGNKRNVQSGALLRLPYLSVADPDGNRWLANVSTDDVIRTEPGGQYVMRVQVREVTRNTAPVVFDPPTVEPEPVPIDEEGS